MLVIMIFSLHMKSPLFSNYVHQVPSTLSAHLLNTLYFTLAAPPPFSVIFLGSSRLFKMVSCNCGFKLNVHIFS